MPQGPAATLTITCSISVSALVLYDIAKKCERSQETVPLDVLRNAIFQVAALVLNNNLQVLFHPSS